MAVTDILIDGSADTALPLGILHQPLDILIDSRDNAIATLELVSGGEVNSGSVS
jgi:hypothetical protein